MARERNPVFRLMLSLAVLALMIGAAAWSNYRLKQREQALVSLRAEAGAVQDRIRKAHMIDAAVPPAAARTVLNDEAGLGVLLERISHQMVEGRMTERSIQSLPPVATQRWQRFPLSLSCRGEFPQVLDLLRELEDSPSLVRVDRIALSRDPREPQTPLTAQLALSAYARKTQ